jgi:radical SAM superfamily enzyme YgiQ (UPF0313 family)
MTDKKIKVNLINPPSPWLICDRDMPSQGILNIAAFLREKGVDVTVTDLAGLPEQYWFIPDADIYGITCVTPQFTYVKKIAEKIKNRQPDTLVVIGGVHPTVLPEMTLEKIKCDIVVRGEGEIAMFEIVNGRRDRIIDGQLIENLDDIPFPAWDMIDIYDYSKIGTNSFFGPTKNNKEGYIQTGRGCPFNCAFCAQAFFTKRKVRYKSIPRIISEVKLLMDKYKCDRFYFFDDTFIIDKRRVLSLCDELAKIKGIDWHCLSRADTTDLELYRKMKAAGCIGITYGIESGSQKILDIVNKGTTIEQNLEAIKVAKEAGLKVRCQVIVGLPGETEETIKETEELIRKSSADTWGIHIFVPLPGSDIWEYPEKFNFPIEKNTDFSYYHTIGRRNEDEAANLHQNPRQVIEWKNHLEKVIGNKDIHKYAEARIEKSE